MKSKIIITLTMLAILCGGFARPAQAAPASAPEVYITPLLLNFGNIKANIISPSQAVKVINTGDTSLVLGVMVASPEFAINNACNGKTLEPSQACTFLVAFRPVSNGIKNGTVSIPSNASLSPDQVVLYGTSFPTGQLLRYENFRPPQDLTLIPSIPWETAPQKLSLFSFWDCTVSLSDRCSARLSGRPRWEYAEQSIFQWGYTAGPAGTQYFFGLASKAEKVPDDGRYLVQLAFFNLNQKQVGIFELPFRDGIHDFEMEGAIVSVPAQFSYYMFKIIFQETSGVAWFDNALLIRLP